MPTTRNYICKDVEMLSASKTIVKSFKNHLPELSRVRTNWNEAYVAELDARIEAATSNLLGLDAKKELRSSSAELQQVLLPARRDLSFFKTQIDEDFKHNPDLHNEILNALGFNRHLRKVQTGNQEALVQLLYTFKTNLSPKLLRIVTQKGLNPQLIETINGYAEVVNQANLSQESFKSTTKELSNEVRNTFNQLYDEIIAICKTASHYYQYEPLKKELFTFNKVVANMGTSRKTKEVASEA